MHRSKQTCQCKLQCARNALYKGHAAPSTVPAVHDLPVIDDPTIPPPEDLSPRPKSSSDDHLSSLGAKQGVFPRRRSNNLQENQISILGIDSDDVPPPPEAIFPRPPRRMRQSPPQHFGRRHSCRHNHSGTRDMPGHSCGHGAAYEQAEEDGSPECTPGSHFYPGAAADGEDGVLTRRESLGDIKVDVNESWVAIAILRRDFEQRDRTLTEITRLQDQLQKHLEKALTEVTARVDRLEERTTISPGGVLSTIAESAAEDGTDSCDGYENTPRTTHVEALVKECEHQVLQEVSRQLDNFRREFSAEVSAGQEAGLASMETSMTASMTDSTARLQADLAHLEATLTAGVSRLEEQANALQADVEDTTSRVIRLEGAERNERTSISQSQQVGNGTSVAESARASASQSQPVGSAASLAGLTATHPAGFRSGTGSWSMAAPSLNGLGVLAQRRLIPGTMPQSVGSSGGTESVLAPATERLALERLQRRLAGRVSGMVSVLNHQPRQEGSPSNQAAQVATRTSSRPTFVTAGPRQTASGC